MHSAMENVQVSYMTTIILILIVLSLVFITLNFLKVSLETVAVRARRASGRQERRATGETVRASGRQQTGATADTATVSDVAVVETVPTSVNYHFTRQCNYKCGFCFHTAISSFVLPLDEAKRGLQMLRDAGKMGSLSYTKCLVLLGFATDC